MFNCPTRGIGTNNIVVMVDGTVIDEIELNQNLTSCNYLVRACVDQTLLTTSQHITLNFNSFFQRIYVADVTFYSNMNRQCSPVGPITTSVITTTTTGNYQLFYLYWVCGYLQLCIGFGVWSWPISWNDCIGKETVMITFCFQI